MKESEMKKHVTAVGAIHLGFGIIGIVGAIIAFWALNFAKGFIVEDEIPYKVMSFIAISVPALIFLLSTLGLVGGIGLLMLHSWARYVGIITAALGCLNIPIGTLVGVYSLWVLFQDDTIKLFENKTQTVDS
jgi:hypothetical protein